MRAANANGQADHSAEDMPSRPNKQRKIEDVGSLPPASLEAALRRSPRRSAGTASKSTPTQSQMVSASSPGPRCATNLAAAFAARSPRKHARDAPSSSSLFNSIPPSAFDSDFGALGTDLFSALTSDAAPMGDSTTTGDFDAIFSDADLAKLFSDAPGPSDNPSLNSSGTHLLPDLFAGQQLHSDGLTDLPPSSPPRHRARDKLFPEALNTASESGSPNMGDGQADTPKATTSASGVQAAVPSAVADTVAASGVTWSEDAVNALTNALLAQAAKHGTLDLSEHTLRDLFATFAQSASPEGKTPQDGPTHPPGSTPIFSPSPTQHAAEKAQVNIKPVGEVNAEVALEM